MRAMPRSVAAQMARPWPARSRTWLKGVPTADVPGYEENSSRSAATKVSAASLEGVRSVAAHTPPGQLKTAPTRADGKPNVNRCGNPAPSGRYRAPTPEVPRYHPRLSNDRAAAV